MERKRIQTPGHYKIKKTLRAEAGRVSSFTQMLDKNVEIWKCDKCGNTLAHLAYFHIYHIFNS